LALIGAIGWAGTLLELVDVLGLDLRFQNCFASLLFRFNGKRKGIEGLIQQSTRTQQRMRKRKRKDDLSKGKAIREEQFGLKMKRMCSQQEEKKSR
jgi:hypothetical protein